MPSKSRNSGTDTCLSVKTHRFPFQFKLPAQLPASFEGEFGSIRYTIRVIIEIPFQLNRELVESITILRIIDSNDPQLEVFESHLIDESIFMEYFLQII